MVPPIKRPILPIVIRISPNSKEPLTTGVHRAYYHDRNQVFDYQYIYIMRMAEVLSILPMSSSTLTSIAMEPIDRTAARIMASYSGQPSSARQQRTRARESQEPRSPRCRFLLSCQWREAGLGWECKPDPIEQERNSYVEKVV
jgi:hypothetical protein